jgi:hypothetical protein
MLCGTSESKKNNLCNQERRVYLYYITVNSHIRAVRQNRFNIYQHFQQNRAGFNA